MAKRREPEASPFQGIAVWLGWLLFGISLLNTLALAFSGWAINARTLSAGEMGQAPLFSATYTATLTASVNLALFSAVLAAGAWFISVRAALWLCGAAMLSGLPLAALSLLGH
jgi:Na+-translocating ferredoxin:NAD+ oxidoreductase RnfD subunit